MLANCLHFVLSHQQSSPPFLLHHSVQMLTQQTALFFSFSSPSLSSPALPPPPSSSATHFINKSFDIADPLKGSWELWEGPWTTLWESLQNTKIMTYFRISFFLLFSLPSSFPSSLPPCPIRLLFMWVRHDKIFEFLVVSGSRSQLFVSCVVSVDIIKVVKNCQEFGLYFLMHQATLVLLFLGLHKAPLLDLHYPR